MTGADPTDAALDDDLTQPAPDAAPIREARDSAPAEAEQSTAAEIDPGRQVELDLGIVSTGDARVDAALAELEALAGTPVADHPAVFEGVHQGLHSALTELDEG